jgi:DNA-binding NtrC family response regulator
MDYDWPGNVRELQNVIERAVILARGGVLRFDLPLRDAPEAARRPAVRAGDEEEDVLTDVELRRRERENLLRVLERTGWKIKGRGGAAELLGVNPNTLAARMKSMGLRRPS